MKNITRKRAPEMNPEDLYDAHLDPLWLSPDHLYPQPGWLFLVAYGPNIEDDMFTYTYTLGMDRFWCEHRLIPMTVRITGTDDHDREGSASTYHHPSEEWVREVGRQLVSGERKIGKTGYDYSPLWRGTRTKHNTHIPVCTVDIFRKNDPSTPDYETSTLIQELKAPSCIGCGGAEGRWER